jgi:dihydroorotate dehydrogenase (fumarate)
MMTSALLRHGPEHLAHVEVHLRDWLAAHGHTSLDQLRGRLSQRVLRDPRAWERANYTRMLASHGAGGPAS